MLNLFTFPGQGPDVNRPAQSDMSSVDSDDLLDLGPRPSSFGETRAVRSRPPMSAAMSAEPMSKRRAVEVITTPGAAELLRRTEVQVPRTVHACRSALRDTFLLASSLKKSDHERYRELHSLGTALSDVCPVVLLLYSGIQEGVCCTEEESQG